MSPTNTDIDDYIARFDGDVRARLTEVRAALHRSVPGADERISYAIPCLRLDGRDVIYFSGWKHHIGIYPVPQLDADLARSLAPYLASKATAKFPHRKPLPIDLIEALASAARSPA
jgi:uncharacterized protein YdhG (YjbR/CyaY superfamily)